MLRICESIAPKVMDSVPSGLISAMATLSGRGLATSTTLWQKESVSRAGSFSS